MSDNLSKYMYFHLHFISLYIYSNLIYCFLSVKKKKNTLTTISFKVEETAGRQICPPFFVCVFFLKQKNILQFFQSTWNI
jgi:hypothetical protein